MKQRVMIVGSKNGVTRVREISGSRRADDLYIDMSEMGTPGEIIEVPEFWLETFESETAEKYWSL